VTEVDLDLYARVSEYLGRLEPSAAGMGAGVIVLRWMRERGLSEQDRQYIYSGFARLIGHREGRGWRSLPGCETLDSEVWTLYRAWVDRYGASALVAAR
jgi:hypothetical protein